MAEPIKIMIIDDSEDDRFLYRRTLQADAATHYKFIEQQCGDEALDCLDSEMPSCVLLDYSLPGRNGIEVLKRIRDKYPFIAVVMLTGHGNEAVAVNAMREGAQHYISKASITPEALQRSVRVAIEHCALQQHIHEQRTSLEMFTRALAHDLNEPVRTIRSFLDLIAEGNLAPEKHAKYFSYIQHAAERMGALIETVYFYMRLDNKEQQPAQESFDSQQALKSAQENLAALIREKQAVITCDLLPAVQANRMQLIQVMQNLIGNAIQHCDGPVTIHVSAQMVDGRWQFRVADNGPGIPAEYREKIFDPFKRLQKRKEDGLGLGLAICRKIIESGGGAIWCEPVSPRGAAFCFSVAAAQAATTATAAPAQQNMQQPLANILIVEDNEADIELTRFALLEKQRLWCHLFISTNGREALAQLNSKARTESPIDLVLLDINMPGMDGFEVLTQMRSMDKIGDVPVVMCSTSAYDRDVLQARSLGSAGYLVKPLDFDKLKLAIENIRSLNLAQEDNSYVLMRASNS